MQKKKKRSHLSEIIACTNYNDVVKTVASTMWYRNQELGTIVA